MDETASQVQPGPVVPEDARVRYFDRELSWLAFNGRVLQEAADPRVPLFDRLLFLAIFSSNLDEFFRVRVAGLRSLLRLKKKKRRALGLRPRRLLREIHFVVTSQQQTFADIFRNQILPELAANGIFLRDERSLTSEQRSYLRRYTREQLRDQLHPRVLNGSGGRPFLRQENIYLVVELWPGPEVSLAYERPTYGLVEVPAPPLSRFLVLPGDGHQVIFLDDVIRLSLTELFPAYEVGSAYAVKLSRDAELYLEDEFEGNLVEKIKKALEKRDTGLPSRFLYDLQAPYGLVAFLKELFALEDDDLVPAGRYHNLQDLASFPRPEAADHLVRPPLLPLPHPALRDASSILTAIQERDHLLHYPYQSFEYVLRFLREAAQDPAVERIWITLYRVAEDSEVVRALMEAARRGAQVTAFVEVKARFDEARNLEWAAEMEQSGVRTVYSKPGIKVHAKMLLVSRRQGGTVRQYAYLSTGNFNENTARVYADHGLFTADPRLTEDVERVFRYLWEEVDGIDCRHLLAAPEQLREGLRSLIEEERARAVGGRSAVMVLKANGLQDPEITDALYAASQDGVRIELLIRGIFTLRPGLEGLSEGIRARSIVGRFLEHARIFSFSGDPENRLFLSSADLMTRNLDRRVEVAFPVYDPVAREELEHLLRLQLADNTKARWLDADQANAYVPRRPGEPEVDAQEDFYAWLRRRLEGSVGEESRPVATAGREPA